MPVVVGVRFRNAGKLFYFAPGTADPKAGDHLIVETARGIEFAETILAPHEIREESVPGALKRVLRIATPDDHTAHLSNREKEREAHRICREKIAEHKLDMKLVRVEYTFDRTKLIAYFTSNGRVDFRALVKDLASAFRTRIELKQIGVRDEAKMLGGLGICGKSLCCSTFLGDFHPVSIKMAKEQNLSLNPTKISGVCGRLMCCLKYEEDHYVKARKSMPGVGKEVLTPDGRGTVLEVNILKERVKVRVAKGNDTEVQEYAAADVQRISQPSSPRSAPSKAPRRQDAAVEDVSSGSEQEVQEQAPFAISGPVEDRTSEE